MNLIKRRAKSAHLTKEEQKHFWIGQVLYPAIQIEISFIYCVVFISISI